MALLIVIWVPPPLTNSSSEIQDQSDNQFRRKYGLFSPKFDSKSPFVNSLSDTSSEKFVPPILFVILREGMGFKLKSASEKYWYGWPIFFLSLLDVDTCSSQTIHNFIWPAGARYSKGSDCR